MTLALDHVFVFVTAEEAGPGGAARSALEAIGLVPSYERRHHGQGTANVCWCFDDAYLELLFVVDPEERDRDAPARNGFARRSTWRDSGASPFGIAVRGGPPPGDTWDYRIAAFPPGLSIPVSTDSDDPTVPFVFASPGNEPPIAWSDDRAGGRQTGAGLSTLVVEELGLPSREARVPVLDALAGAGAIERLVMDVMEHTMVLRLGGRLRLRLPDFTLLPGPATQAPSGVAAL